MVCVIDWMLFEKKLRILEILKSAPSHIRHLSQPTFYGGWPLKSCTHTGIFPSVSGHPAVKRKPRKVPTMCML